MDPAPLPPPADDLTPRVPSPLWDAEPLELPPDEPPAPPPPPADVDHGEPPTQTFRRLLRAGIAFLILFLTVRTVAVEPFGVPTGSMAPTLIGIHREGPCPRCGHPVRVGDPGVGNRAQYADGHCPNCGKRGVDLSDARDVGGDRLMVDKNVFALRSPRRWEVAVFRCPVDDSKPYVKRVVGLPGEAVQIRDGDVYADGQILRKGLAEVRETRLPFFDMAFAPKPHGWAARWLVEPAGQDPALPPVDAAPPVPVGPSILNGDALHLDGTDGKTVGVTYRHAAVDDRSGGDEQAVTAWNSYNGPPPTRAVRRHPAHDFAVVCDLEVPNGATGTFSCRLFDGADAVTLDLPVGPAKSVQAALTHEAHGGLAAVGGFALTPGKSHRLEFSFFDRRVTAAVDGSELFEPADLPPAAKRGDVSRPFQLGVRGCRVVVRSLRLFQDIYYTAAGRNAVATPYRLGPADYFMLGDNSENSQDAREWAVPGVPAGAFVGKPFLVHQPLRVGRATVGGRERAFQTVDWSRLRWVH